MYFFERSYEKKEPIIYDNYYTESNYLDDIELILESDNNTKIMLQKLYPIIESKLSTPVGDRKFKQLVGQYMDRNNEKLHTSGPVYLIPFGDTDKQGYYDLFEIDPKEVVSLVNDVLKGMNAVGEFKLLKNNPIFWIFYLCIRYYYIKNDKQGLNVSLAIYALAVYPSVFHKYFKYEVDAGVMQYTIDNLTEKFIIKQQGHIFGALFVSIQHSFDFLKGSMKGCEDKEIIRFIQRIRNDQSSMLKKICDFYMQNHRKGLRVSLTKDSNVDEMPIDVEAQNKTSTVEYVTRKVTLPILTNGVSLSLAGKCAQISGISISDVRFYMSKIVTSKYNEDIEKFIESILFLYLYDENKKAEEINSRHFILWSADLFRKTNSNNVNIKRIKDTLNKWAEEVGVHEKFKREASRVNYKRAIFFYFIFSIQTYNLG